MTLAVGPPQVALAITVASLLLAALAVLWFLFGDPDGEGGG